jgi:hypothetical protein
MNIIIRTVIGKETFCTTDDFSQAMKIQAIHKRWKMYLLKWDYKGFLTFPADF